jgi:hypothetical protein
MKIRIKSIRQMIEETDPSDVRISRIEAAESDLRFEQEERKRQRFDLESRPAPRPRTAAEAHLRYMLVVLAVILITVDAVVQFSLNSMYMTGLSKRTWLFLSPFIALGIAALTHAVATALSTDPTRSRRTARISLWAAGWSGLICAAAGAVVLYFRTAPPATLSENMLTALAISMWLLAEALAITAGLCSAAAHAMYLDELHARRLVRIKRREEELNEFAQWLEARKTEARKELDAIKTKELAASLETAGSNGDLDGMNQRRGNFAPDLVEETV